MNPLKVSLIRVGADEYRQFRDWRNLYIGDNPANEDDFNFWEAVRDECSYIFGFYQNNKLVGGVRLTPVGHGLTIGEKIHAIDKWGIENSPGIVLDVNRLVVDVTMRGSGVMKNALLECFQWVKSNTTHSVMVAFCSENLVPLYTKVGAKLVRSGLTSPTTFDKEYSLIALNLGEAP